MSFRLRRSAYPGAWRQIPRGDLAGVRRDVQAPQRRDGARDLGLSKESHDAKHRQATVVDLRAQPGKSRTRRNGKDSCIAKNDGSPGGGTTPQTLRRIRAEAIVEPQKKYVSSKTPHA